MIVNNTKIFGEVEAAFFGIMDRMSDAAFTRNLKNTGSAANNRQIKSFFLQAASGRPVLS